MTYLVLVRHGRTALNRVPTFRGQADVPLDEVGLAQAEATAQHIADRWHLDAVYSSPLCRARQTAAPIAGAFDLEVEAVPGLIDMTFGELDGVSVPEVKARWPGTLEAWSERPHEATFPGGESLSTFRPRIMGSLLELLERHPEGWIAVVGHNVVNRVLLLGALGLDNDRFWHLGQKNCAVNLLRYDGKDFDLLLMNDVCHLRHL